MKQMADQANPNARPCRKLWRSGLLLETIAVALVLGIVAFGVYFCVAMFSLSFLASPYDGRAKIEFSTSAWLDAKNNPDDGVRYLMLDSLLSNKRLIGCSHAEVEA